MSEQRAAYDGQTTPFDPMIPVPTSELKRLMSYAADAYDAGVRASKGTATPFELAALRVAASVVKVGLGRIVREDAERLVALFPPIGA